MKIYKYKFVTKKPSNLAKKLKKKLQLIFKNNTEYFIIIKPKIFYLQDKNG